LDQINKAAFCREFNPTRYHSWGRSRENLGGDVLTIFLLFLVFCCLHARSGRRIDGVPLGTYLAQLQAGE